MARRGSLQTSHTHSLPLDALEMLLIGPYAAFHMGQFLMLTRVSFLSLLPESLLIFPSTSTRPFVSLRCFSPDFLILYLYLSTPAVSHTSLHFSPHSFIFAVCRWFYVLIVLADMAGNVAFRVS